MLRSEKVERISLYFRNEDLKDCITRIGASSLVQLEDMNQDCKFDDLAYAKELRIIEKLEQRMCYFKNDIVIEDILDRFDRSVSFDEAKTAIDKCYGRLVELRHVQKDHQRMQIMLEEDYVVAAEAQRFVHSIVPGGTCSVDFDLMSGIVDRDKKFLIRKALRQRLRRNIFVKMIDVELESIEKQKTVLIVYVLGEHAAKTAQCIIEAMGGRVRNGFREDIQHGSSHHTPTGSAHACRRNEPAHGTEIRGSAHRWPGHNGHGAEENAGKPSSKGECCEALCHGDAASLRDSECLTAAQNDSSGTSDADDPERDNAVEALRREYTKVQRLNKASQRHIDSFLRKAGKQYVCWKYCINREKAIFEAMNKLQRPQSAEYLLGEGWILQENIGALQALKRQDDARGRFTFECMKYETAPPTHFKGSAFTDAFQGFTNVFGVPKYREINPALFLIFTFPFMFGAMFGDILHGILLGILALFMIHRFEQLNHRCGVFQIILEGRYVVLVCALAAVWFGFLYGDFGSLPVALFRSQYEVGRTYPFGIDPVWHHADNKTVFINSVKMKLSLIIGFVHMSLGGAIAICNAAHFKDRITLICVAIPQFIVFTLFLGYLVFLCIYKWLVTHNYPSLVNTLIGMYTSPFTIPQPMYPGQLYVQLLIVCIIVVCVPWMFFSKPLYMVLRRRIPREGVLDLWISSGIHVVEFSLGLISNTSSYLRLWAVSLAHVQLTSVLHQFTIGNASWPLALCLAPVYVACTLLLLLGLEGLSACLHALRLNWIEFFSKFYAGGGTPFKPLSFELAYEDIYEDAGTG